MLNPVDIILSAKNETILHDKMNYAALVAYINELILHNFNGLINMLYRVDINEQKLKLLLKENQETDAAALIADLVIERQLQKIKSRREFCGQDNNMNEAEKW